MMGGLVVQPISNHVGPYFPVKTVIDNWTEMEKVTETSSVSAKLPDARKSNLQ